MSMTPYFPPIADQMLALTSVAQLAELADLPAFDAATLDLARAILDQSGAFCAQQLIPLNRVGDRVGARMQDGHVTLPSGFREAHRAWIDGGWGTLAADPEYGGQGLPFVLSVALLEQVASADMAFSLVSMLTSGAIEAIRTHGAYDLKRTFLPRLVSGEWTGTMNLTEPHAGSDVGAIRTRALHKADGSYGILGTKIFISWGDHELADNIIHLVLARLPGAPEGTKGISLFLVPKNLVGADGSIGRRNDVACLGLEHKLGIRASPTCTMEFGANGDCVGYLIGEENGGMRAMFTMMNHARIGVGIQGVAIAERATQAAELYAAARIQSRAIQSSEPATIGQHPDVRRMLLTCRATTDAIRAIAYFSAGLVDRARAHPDAAVRERAQERADLLTPITKAYATDMGVEVTSLAIQIVGGIGYVEESGLAQLYRDARIAPIYEGTNGIQALDLVNRKLGRGDHWRELLDEMRTEAASLPCHGVTGTIAEALLPAIASLGACSALMMERRNTVMGAQAATPYLRMFGIILAGWLLAREVMALGVFEDVDHSEIARQKLITARFFAEQILPQAHALAATVMAPSFDRDLAA